MEATKMHSMRNLFDNKKLNWIVAVIIIIAVIVGALMIEESERQENILRDSSQGITRVEAIEICGGYHAEKNEIGWTVDTAYTLCIVTPGKLGTHFYHVTR